MNCPRPGCNGLLVPETVWDGHLAMDLHRCISCGRMGKPNEQLATDRLPHADQAYQPHKQDGDTMARGPWTQEQRERFHKTMAERRGQPAKPAAEHQSMVPLVHEPIVVDRTPVDFSRLDVVIDETRKDLEAMERVKLIMARHT